MKQTFVVTSRTEENLIRSFQIGPVAEASCLLIWKSLSLRPKIVPHNLWSCKAKCRVIEIKNTIGHTYFKSTLGSFLLNK